MDGLLHDGNAYFILEALSGNGWDPWQKSVLCRNIKDTLQLKPW